MTTNLFGSAAEKMMSRMFRKVDTVVWDLMSGKLGVRTSDGEIATFEGTDPDSASITVNPFDDFGMPIPAFAQSTPLASVKVGDLIYKSGSRPAWVTEVVDKPDGSKRFKTIDPTGTLGSFNPPKVQMLGLDSGSGVLVVRSLLSMFPGGDGLAGLQSTMLPLLMMSEGDSGLDLDKMMPLILMGSLNGGSATAGNGMMQAMLMMKMFGGGNSIINNGGSSRKPTFR